jgi:hypothetical protein
MNLRACERARVRVRACVRARAPFLAPPTVAAPDPAPAPAPDPVVLSPLAVTDVLTGMITNDSDSSRPWSSSQIYLLYRDLTTGTCVRARAPFLDHPTVVAPDPAPAPAS